MYMYYREKINDRQQPANGFVVSSWVLPRTQGRLQVWHLFLGDMLLFSRYFLEHNMYLYTIIYVYVGCEDVKIANLWRVFGNFSKTLQHAALHYNTRQCTATHFETETHQKFWCPIWDIVTFWLKYRNPCTLQHSILECVRVYTARCSTPQHTATHCNTLWHTTYCNTLP